MDFLNVKVVKEKSRYVVVPKFLNLPSKDLMVRGGDFYAIWDEERGLWSEDPYEAVRLIDNEVQKYYDNMASHEIDGLPVVPLFLEDVDNGLSDSWNHYVRAVLKKNFVSLNGSLIFQDTPPRKENYASIVLPYSLTHAPCDAWDELIGALYEPSERDKLEWAIGCIVSGDSVFTQKFIVLYGAPRSGKSTVLNIIDKLFAGYTASFSAAALGSRGNTFAMEPFRGNPLVAIDQDGDLSRITTNTVLNTIISHDKMTMNEKFKSSYDFVSRAFLFVGSNSPVEISDAKSGLVRRLIDVNPRGVGQIPTSRYRQLMNQIEYELGAIAQHCLDVYLEDPYRYDDYQPTTMIRETNDFYNFVMEFYDEFDKPEGITASRAWDMYKQYCDDADIVFRLNYRKFKTEMKEYFDNFEERSTSGDGGMRHRNLYTGFKRNKFMGTVEWHDEKPSFDIPEWLKLAKGASPLDEVLADCAAQYATDDGAPKQKWDNVKTTLKDINTSIEHYVCPPDSMVVIDFDLKDSDGNKCFEKNAEAASNFPKTYAETSRSGGGLHLHYFYEGDVSQLSRVYGDNIEVKIFTGKSALRRKLTICNRLGVATISSGLPFKETKMINDQALVLKDEKHLRAIIKKALKKDISTPYTVCCIDLIATKLDEAYKSGMTYNVTDLYPAVINFASRSTHHAEECLEKVAKMHFESEKEVTVSENKDDSPITFFDVEVFPNLFVVCWKEDGWDHCTQMINPSGSDIEELTQRKLVGFNNRRYDNHILWARMLGYSNQALYDMSQNIINGDGRGCMFRDAYGLSYTDIYDFASAGNKKSLKKLEIEMGIHHMELGLPWDQPVDEKLWPKVAEYCCNDVNATEAAFHYLESDWTARQILADLADGTVNDSTNQLTTKFIFGNDKNPQREFNYRNLANPAPELGYPDAFFPGYKYDPYATADKSTYRGVVVGEGGYVYAEPGIYYNVALLDIASMHPSSIVAEQLFGKKYTKKFQEIMDARLSIKHEDWDTTRAMLDGKLGRYVDKVINGEFTSTQLANALKTAINSVYGLTSAKFDNPFRDKRNIDNIVAKRGALFMVDLMNEVQARGFTVAHIKTDSIKIPNATPEIIQFVMDFGRKYGYTFEHEATYDRMCLVNDAVYIAKYATAEDCQELYGYSPGKNSKKGGQWTATGAQFAVPYVFKTLFSHEEIVFSDLCETKSVQSSMFLDFNEKLSEEEHSYVFIGRTGLFCPMVPGSGGGLLMRYDGDKYSAVVGTKGYRWQESEVVQSLGLEGDIDRTYYNSLVDNAVEAISQYGSVDEFIDN